MIFNDIRIDILKKENQKLKTENENLKYELELIRRKYDVVEYKAKLYDENYKEFNETVENLRIAKEAYNLQTQQIKDLKSGLSDAVNMIKDLEQA